MAPRTFHQRIFAHVERIDVLPLFCGRLGVIPFPAAAVRDDLHRQRTDDLTQRVAQAAVMALFEKGDAGAHHLLIVSGLPARVDEQIDIALSGHIEAVPISAAECLSFSFSSAWQLGQRSINIFLSFLFDHCSVKHARCPCGRRACVFLSMRKPV